MIYLTYAHELFSDGFGGQYHRIFAIIAIANLLNFEYVHNKSKIIAHITPEYGHLIDDYLGLFNKFKSIDNTKFDKIISIDNPLLNDLTILKSKYNNINLLVKIFNPFLILHKNINLLENALPSIISLKKNIVNYNYNNNIAIHIRRGDVSKYQNYYKYTTIHFYKNLIDKLISLYPNYNIHIFTQKLDEEETNILNNYNNLFIYSNTDLIETFDYLTKADVLVIAKSCLSYLAALYNNNIVYYFDYWAPKLNNWINLNTIIEIEKPIKRINNGLLYKLAIGRK